MYKEFKETNIETYNNSNSAVNIFRAGIRTLTAIAIISAPVWLTYLVLYIMGIQSIAPQVISGIYVISTISVLVMIMVCRE